MLSSREFTDTELCRIKGLTKLQVLNLSWTGISDVGLKNIQGLGQLREVDLGYTHVTYEGVAKLQRALPNCKIVR